MDKTKEQEFGKIRNLFFPIHGYELKKFIPLALLFFCIAYNYSVLRGSKDIFILGKSGASAIYYLKTFGVTPAVFLLTIIYSWISTKTGRDGRFNIVLIYFLSFFAIYMFFILPNVENLQLTEFGDSMTAKYPRFKGLWSIITNWHTSLFYIHAEGWGTYALSILFWTFANEIVNLKQAKRFFGLLIAIGANIGAFAAGFSLKHVFKGNANFTLSSILVIGILALIVYNYLSKAVASNPNDYQIEDKPAPKKKKLKLSIGESFSFLFKSPYLLLIASLVLCYSMSIALFEAVWKDRVGVYAAGNKTILAGIYGNQLMYIGLTTIVLLLFLSPWVRKKSWNIMAFITPVVFTVGTLLFFAFMLFGEYFTNLLNSDNLNTLQLAVFIGLGNVIFIKAAKYAFFDPSKEMAYVPLDENSKIRGKAAVDGVGSRLGKSIGALSVTFVFMQLPGTGGTIGGAKIYIALAIISLLVIWLFSVVNLGIKFAKVSKEQGEPKV